MFEAARALRSRVRSPHAPLLVQWRLVADWVSRAHVSARVRDRQEPPHEQGTRRTQ